MCTINKHLLLSFFLLTIIFPFSNNAYSNERIAGRVHVSEKNENSASYEYEEYDERQNTSSSDRLSPSLKVVSKRSAIKTASITSISKQNLNYLESLGTLYDIKLGALGIDTWNDSEYKTILTLIETLPDTNEYAPLYDIKKRLLLSKTDTKFLKNKYQNNEKDLFILRIEKLIEMGAFTDAADLYLNNPFKPHNERLVKAGVMALLYSKQTSLACLETKAFLKQFSDRSFWNELNILCEHHFGQEIKNAPDSIILTNLINKTSYIYKPSTVEEFANLSLLEKVALFSENKISYKKLKNQKLDILPLWMIALLLEDKNLPQRLKLPLTILSAQYGLKKSEAIKTLYKDIKIDQKYKKPSNKKKALQELPKWQLLAFLYQEAEKTEDKTKETVIKTALKRDDLTVLELLPFASYINKSSIFDLDAESYEKALHILFLNSESFRESEIEKLISKENELKASSQNISVLTLALIHNSVIDLPYDQITKTFKSDGFKGVIEDQKALYLHDIFIKLDKTGNLHNYSAVKVYEKQLDLTFENNYVMPVDDLVTRLEKAQEHNRLGETVLLSSLLLQNVGSEIEKIALLREVIQGLSTVGLIVEARALTKSLITGL
jgi:hypothetical protein